MKRSYMLGTVYAVHNYKLLCFLLHHHFGTCCDGAFFNTLQFTATPFPKNFMQSVKVIYTRLFRIYAIVYYHHYPQLGELQYSFISPSSYSQLLCQDNVCYCLTLALLYAYCV